MALKWAARRQMMYYAVGGVLAIALLYAGYQTFFTAEASCRNGAQDVGERGVDCGGVCTLLCTQDAREPVVLWARSFVGLPGKYTAAAYIQNNNVGAGARNIAYTFQLFDKDNILVTERRGTTTLPPTQVVPILEPNIDTGTREVARTHFAFAQTPLWHRATAPLPQLKVQNQSLAADGSRLSANLVNESLYDVSRVTVIAVLFNQAGVALGASKSTVSVPAKASEFAVFTWSPAPEGVARAEITVLPPF